MEEMRFKWSETLQDLLECPICCEIPKRSVHQCMNGHHLCENCRWRLMECPVCKYPFLNTRNLIVETLSAKFDEIKLSLLDPDNDINKKKLPETMCVATQTEKEQKRRNVHIVGKQKETNSNNATASRKDCSEQELPLQDGDNSTEVEKDASRVFSTLKIGKGCYPCLIHDCPCELPFPRLMEHIKHSHGQVFYKFDSEDGHFLQKWMLSYGAPKKYDLAFFVRYIGLFFLKININEKGDIIACVQIVNSSAAGKQFTCKLEIGDTRRTMRNHTRKIRSCRLKGDLLSAESLHIKASEFRKMMREKRSFNCLVSITRKKYACA